MLIDVSDVSTIPVDVKKKIIDSFASLPSAVVYKIKSCEVESTNDILCAIEDYYGPFKAFDFYDDLKIILERHELVCFHAAKMTSKNLVLRNGLEVNDWDIYKTNVENAYRNSGVSENKIQEAINIIKHEYSIKYSRPGRKAQLCFFANMSMFEGKYAAFDQFCENIGGELARKALKNKHPELYQPLKENGKSFVVKFRIPYANIVDYDKDSVGYKFVVYYAGLYFWNKEYGIQFDSNIQKDVLPEDILGTIDIDKEICY